MDNKNKIILISIGVVISTIVIITTSYVISNPNIKVEKEIRIVTTFYPLYEFTNNIVKDKAKVEMLIPPGVEVHDWEPSAKDIEQLRDADLLIYNDNSLESYIKKVDINKVAVASDLIKDNNPHVWLDPLLAKEQVKSILNAILTIDKENEEYYKKNAEEYMNELKLLHEEYVNGLSDCEKREFIVFHAAYSYLADRYNLTQITLIGTDIEIDDLSVQEMREIIDTAKEKNVKFVYAEEHLDERIMKAFAEEVNAQILILNPIEVYDGVSYVDEMRNNLENLRIGLVCR
ncbi:MAG: zinc ABC transporter substrate-binding protein [Candidatus Nitrosocaldaceae archaeon]